jgi:hypothetical protein
VSQRLHTHHIVERVQVACAEKAGICAAFSEPSLAGPVVVSSQPGQWGRGGARIGTHVLRDEAAAVELCAEALDARILPA